MMYQDRIQSRIGAIVVAAGLCISAASHATVTLTSADWKNAGDSLVTIDENGLEWLDLTATRGRSYSDVSSRFGAGQEFAGWRYATAEEVEGLWTSAGGAANSYDGWSAQNNGVFDALAPYWGDTYCFVYSCSPGDGYAWAINGDTNPDTGNHYVSYVYDWVFDSAASGKDYLNARVDLYITTTTSFEEFASALVRTSVSLSPGTPGGAGAPEQTPGETADPSPDPVVAEQEQSAPVQVPEPATLALLVAGLAGLPHARRKHLTRIGHAFS